MSDDFRVRGRRAKIALLIDAFNDALIALRRAFHILRKMPVLFQGLVVEDQLQSRLMKHSGDRSRLQAQRHRPSAGIADKLHSFDFIGAFADYIEDIALELINLKSFITHHNSIA